MAQNRKNKGTFGKGKSSVLAGEGEDLLESFADKVEKNRRGILVGLGGVAVLFLLLFAWSAWASAKEKAATKIYAEVLDVLEKPVVPQEEMSSEVTSEQKDETFASEEEQLLAALDVLNPLEKKYSGLAASQNAKVLKASLLSKLAVVSQSGSAKEALAAYQTARKTGDPYYRALSSLGVGLAYENIADTSSSAEEKKAALSKAKTAFQAAESFSSNDEYVAASRYHVGRLLQTSGDTEAARAVFEKIANAEKKSSYASLAEARLAVLDTKKTTNPIAAEPVPTKTTEPVIKTVPVEQPETKIHLEKTE